MLMINDIERYGNTASKNVFVQLVDEHDMEMMHSETEAVHAISGISDFCITAVPVSDWNQDLTPWCADPVFGRKGFGNGASKTLHTLLEALDKDVRCFFCGYSLAGLFALWAGYQTDIPAGVVAVSPSVWYPGWISYAEKNHIKSSTVYLSLSDREGKTRNPVMASVDDAIRRQYDILTSEGKKTTLEWNPGNHFADSDIRMAKGISWMMKQAVYTNDAIM